MDYEEEQQMELEALEAILGEDGLLKYEGTVPSGWSEDRLVYKVQIKPDTDDADLDLSIDLLFQHTPKYPEAVPCLKVSNTRGLTDADAGALTTVMADTAQENAGMASIFAVIQAVKDWLETKAGLEEAVDPAVVKKQQEEAEEQARQKARAEGTPVTPETFAAWRAKFDAEARAAREAAGEGVADAEGLGKTGKAWFLEKDRPEVGEGEDDDLDFDEDEEDETEFGLGDEDEDDNGSDDEDFLDAYLAGQT